MSKYWKLKIDKRRELKISFGLIEELSKFRQLNNKDNESGGTLIGSFLSNDNGFIIDKLTIPQKKDKQTRHSFYRSEQHNEIVQKIWKETNGFSTFLGLWHTHREDIPKYSSIDKKDWLDSLVESKYEKNCLFFFIVGLTHIRCWIGINGIFFNKIKLLGDYKYE